MFTLFQQGFASGFLAGAVCVLVFLIAWEFIARAVTHTRMRRERLTETTRFRRTGWLVMSAHNEHDSIDRAFRVKD